jgi:hypothetical protein
MAAIAYVYNPFATDATPPWQLVIANVLYSEVCLTAIDGLKLKREWKAQKSKETSENTYVWSGETTEQPELTLEAVDRAGFAEILALLTAMAPVPGYTPSAAASSSSSTATPTAQAVGAPTTAEGLLAQAQASLAAIDKPTSTGSSSSSGDTSSSSSSTTPAQNAGPRPPTLTIDNPILSLAGITAFACGDVTLPLPNDTLGWVMKVKLVPQKPVTPAGVGTIAPATAGGPKGTQYVAAGLTSSNGSASPQTTAPTAQQSLAASAAGAV